MKKPKAHGLALSLALMSLGAAHGPEMQGRITEASLAGWERAKLERPLEKPVRLKGSFQVGTASWYGDYFQGRETASGEPYDMNDLTAAHPTLPLGTFVRVTNLRNGKAVILRVNDRGPVVDGRIIDVSCSAAKILGMRGRGIQRVRLDLVRPNFVHQASARDNHRVSRSHVIPSTSSLHRRTEPSLAMLRQ